MLFLLLFFGSCPLPPCSDPSYAFHHIFKVSGRQSQAVANMLAETSLLVLEYLSLNTNDLYP